jgi:6-phosphogluconolactonase (cycloisomerase 2 family)
LLDSVPTGGDWPRHAVLDPAEERLYVANQRSGTVTWLPRDTDSGRLSPVAGSTTVEAVAMVMFG